jgi:hypothetical protein
MLWRIEETRQAHFETLSTLLSGTSLPVEKSQNIVSVDLKRCRLLSLSRSLKFCKTLEQTSEATIDGCMKFLSVCIECEFRFIRPVSKDMPILHLVAFRGMSVSNVYTAMKSGSSNPHIAPMRFQQMWIDDTTSCKLAWPMIVAKIFQCCVQVFKVVRKNMFSCA